MGPVTRRTKRTLAAYSETGSVSLQVVALFARAHEATRRGRNAAAEGHLREALAAMRAAKLVDVPGCRNDFMARVLADNGYRYQFVFARNAGHTDRAVKQQTLPAALEWLWRGYR